MALTADGRKVIGAGRGPGDLANVRCTLAGPAAGLYLTLWNRSEPDAAGVTVEGDRTVLRRLATGDDGQLGLTGRLGQRGADSSGGREAASRKLRL